MPTTYVEFLRDAHDSPPMLVYPAEETSYTLLVPDIWEYQFPEGWICATEYYKNISFDRKIVPNEETRKLLREKEPLVAIWPYQYGPRQYCQAGGDEDWTAIVRKSAYPEDILMLGTYLGICGTEVNEEGDFVVYTGAHA